MILRKIPRGIIIHSLQESLIYLTKSIFLKLNDKDLVENFEGAFASYCNATYCTSFNFARTAIFFILKSLKLQQGSEVLMPPITTKGILDVVVNQGLRPVYVDLDHETFNLDLKKINFKKNKNIKAAIITPLYGMIPNLEEISLVLNSQKIFSILDFSHSLNAEYNKEKINSFFDASVYSSSSIKILDTLGGGHVVTQDKKLFETLKEEQMSLKNPSRSSLITKAFINLVRNIVTSSPIFDLITYPIIKFISFINRDLVLKQTGRRSKKMLTKLPSIWFTKFSSIQANIGLKMIKKIESIDSKRILNANLIKSKIGENFFARTPLASKNVFWQLIILVNDSKLFHKFCLTKGIDVATSSLELISSLKNYPGRVDLKVASNIYKNGCIIPCNHLLKEKEIERISRNIKIYIDKCS